MNEKLRALGRRWPWLGRALDVQDRVGEINGGFAASAITVSVFIAIFPLLLVAIAVVGFVAHGDTEVTGKIIDNLGLTGTAAQTMRDAIGRASDSRQAASIVGLLGLAWSGSGVAVALQQGVRAPWQERSEGIKDRLLGMAWLVVAGIGFAAVLALGGILNFLPDQVPVALAALGAIAVGLLAEVGLFWWMFWGLGTRRVPARDLLPGAIVAGVGFEVLKLVGTIYVPQLVAKSSSLYGPLGVVFALLAWLAIFAKLIVYTSTLNAVRYEAREGTVEVPIRVPRIPARTPVATTRGGIMLDATDDADPAVPSPVEGSAAEVHAYDELSTVEQLQLESARVEASRVGAGAEQSVQAEDAEHSPAGS
ncbi:YihY/virulence factor BrkB family protein [Aquihabitans sp. G128]|uniref:YihY/virulence factor BrkB family protein n=1 Tax=Aquihabitans sp. G128 TaxID=2849779 RepID=UPI001C23E57C|nr:YihY/virulence factor BrkB family protein [Aquihabitans sp. G128]QXC62387.1 YihY/virulence factor BrkB family protein [Aquihabitans sp. G128]